MSLGIKSSAFLRVEHPLCHQFEVQNLSWIYRASIVNLSWTYVNLIIVHLSWIYRGSIVNLSWTYPRCQPFEVFKFLKIIEFGLKWVHMARYELILRLDGALWLTIISKTPLTPRRAIKIQNRQKTSFFLQGRTPPRKEMVNEWCSGNQT